jgi:hypothetical protein
MMSKEWMADDYTGGPLVLEKSTAEPYSVSAKITCEHCLNGITRVTKRSGRMVHAKITIYDNTIVPNEIKYLPCADWDSECRYINEPIGFIKFAWKPMKCRNGKRRWFKFVEMMGDGTFCLGDRAY